MQPGRHDRDPAGAQSRWAFDIPYDAVGSPQPPGTSKWNTVEHRLFSHITMNWRGRPLASHKVIVQTIAATTTTTGLRVRAELDTSTYHTGVKISDRQMDALPLTRHDWHGDWNYTLGPQDYDQAAGVPHPFDGPSPDLARLCYPALTGLPAPQWDALVTSRASRPGFSFRHREPIAFRCRRMIPAA